MKMNMDHHNTQIWMNQSIWTQLENRGMFLQSSTASFSFNQTPGFRKGKWPYKPSNSSDLQYHNRLKSKRFYHPRKRFNHRFPPFAPRNTTSFLIRAKRSGGIASLVSPPYPVTPVVFSPLREVLVDMAKEEWGLDGYGSMKGLIRVRSGGSGDHDLNRFEMICPSSRCEEHSSSGSSSNLLVSRVDDQDCHIAQLEEENLILKERVFFMERELEDLRTRVQFLEDHQGWCLHLMDNNKEETAASENAFGNGGIVGHDCYETSINDTGNE